MKTQFAPIAVYDSPENADIYTDELKYLKAKLTYDGDDYRVYIEQDAERECDFLRIQFKPGYQGSQWGHGHSVKALDAGAELTDALVDEAVLLYCQEYRPDWKNDDLKEATAEELIGWIADSESDGEDCDDLKALLKRLQEAAN